MRRSPTCKLGSARRAHTCATHGGHADLDAIATSAARSWRPPETHDRSHSGIGGSAGMCTRGAATAPEEGAEPSHDPHSTLDTALHSILRRAWPLRKGRRGHPLRQAPEGSLPTLRLRLVHVHESNPEVRSRGSRRGVAPQFTNRLLFLAIRVGPVISVAMTLTARPARGAHVAHVVPVRS
jgi:hypothetical protein